jgi:hypothetical protein
MTNTKKSRDSSIDTATSSRLDGRASVPGSGKILFSSPQRPNRLWGPMNFLSNGYPGRHSRKKKRPRREADHLPPSSAGVKNGGAIPPPAIHLHGVVLNTATYGTMVPNIKT